MDELTKDFLARIPISKLDWRVMLLFQLLFIYSCSGRIFLNSLDRIGHRRQIRASIGR